MQITLPIAGGLGGITLPDGQLSGQVSITTTGAAVAAMVMQLDNGGYYDINARRFDPKSKAFKQACTAAREQPEQMATNALGIRLCCERAEVRQGTLVLTLSDKRAHGVADGAHLSRVPGYLLERGEDIGQLLLPVGIFIGMTRSASLDMSLGVSTTAPVKEYSRLNQRGDFDGIRKALAGKPYESLIRYSQGGSEPVLVTEILDIMEIMRPRDLVSGTYIFKGTGSGIKSWPHWAEREEKQILSVLPDILWSRDILIYNLPMFWGMQSYGLQVFLKHGRRDTAPKRPPTLYFLAETPLEASHFVPNNLWRLLLSVCRANWRINRVGRMSPVIDNDEFMGNIFPDIVAKLAERSTSNDVRFDKIRWFQSNELGLLLLQEAEAMVRKYKAKQRPKTPRRKATTETTNSTVTIMATV